MFLVVALYRHQYRGLSQRLRRSRNETRRVNFSVWGDNASNDRKQAFRCLQSLVIDGSSGKSTTELECVGFSGGIVFAENRL